MSLLRGSDLISPLRYEQLPKAAEGTLCLQTRGVDVLPKIVNVGLQVTELQCLDARDPDAGSHIAHQVKNAGCVAHALARNRIISDGCEGNKNQAQTCPL